jgi:hypothetical protein
MMQTFIDILTPVLEGSIVLAAHYATQSGRSTVTATDVEYAIKYLAMNHVGDRIGSMFPELYNSSSSDDESVEEVDELDEPFMRYTSGADEWCTGMNKAWDDWDQWVPGCPAEELLKRAIDEKKI